MQISPTHRKKEKKTFSSINESDIKFDLVLNSLAYMQKKNQTFSLYWVQNFYLWKKSFGIVQCFYSVIKNQVFERYSMV